MVVYPLDVKYKELWVERVGRHGPEWLLQSASEAALHDWGTEWFAEAAESNGQRHYFNLTQDTNISGSWSVECSTEDVEPEDNNTIWTVGRRKTRPDHDNTVYISKTYEKLIQQLIGPAETKLLVGNCRDAARCNLADTWFAEVTYRTQRHSFSLKDRSNGSRVWRLEYDQLTLPIFHAAASWACGRRCSPHRDGTLENVTCQAQHETQRVLRDEIARLAHQVLDIQHQLRYMAYRADLSSAHHPARQWNTSVPSYSLSTIGHPA